MVGSYELVVALLATVVSLAIVVVCLKQRCFLRYFFLNVYIIISVAFTWGCFYVLYKEGYDSLAYFYFYYTGDALGTIVGYLVIASLFDQLLRRSIFRPYVRPTLLIFFLLVVGISGLFISRNVQQLYPRFVIEFEQNMYFVGVLLTFLLWMTMTYLGAETRRFALLVSGMGIFFAAHAANYAIRFLFPSLSALTLVVPPLAYNFMVGLWLYTFLWVPEEEVAVQPARQILQRLAPVGAHSSRK